MPIDTNATEEEYMRTLANAYREADSYDPCSEYASMLEPEVLKKAMKNYVKRIRTGHTRSILNPEKARFKSSGEIISGIEVVPTYFGVEEVVAWNCRTIVRLLRLYGKDIPAVWPSGIPLAKNTFCSKSLNLFEMKCLDTYTIGLVSQFIDEIEIVPMGDYCCQETDDNQ